MSIGILNQRPPPPPYSYYECQASDKIAEFTPFDIFSFEAVWPRLQQIRPPRRRANNTQFIANERIYHYLAI